MKLQEARRDLYRRLAKEQGYKSRAAFKLIEANEKYDFIQEGDRVVDFGAAPGGWLQVCSQLVGPRGLVVGLDLHEIHLKEKNVKTVVMDVNDPRVAERIETMLKGKADVVLSDLSPTVSGVWELDQIRQVDLTLRVLDLCGSVLKRNGKCFLKLFEGERSGEVRTEFRRRFTVVRPLKPKASRSASSELYYYCEGLAAASFTAAATSS
ncbi:MAG: RlmE family RNA methyltransferase [Nitrososphaerales archaeon]|nr:RlmE family RNA methyltransferase [Nitrososphaerales archaeon]